MSNAKNKLSALKNSDNSVWGIHAVEALLTVSPEKIQALYINPQRQDKKITQLILLAKKSHIPVNRLPARIAPENYTQGVMAICKADGHSENQLYFTSINDLLDYLDSSAQPALLLVLDRVQDPHNLGACIRTANAAGCQAVIIPKDRAAPLNATVRKTASGAAEYTPVISVTNLARTLLQLKERHIWIYGLSGESASSLYQEKLAHSAAFVMGAEGQGLRRLTLDQCDTILSIPMAGNIESLNVSVASAVCLYEAVRQRNIQEK